MNKIQKLSFALVALAIMVGLSAFQKQEVPANVLSRFKKMFPSAKKIDWSKEAATEWEAEFHMNNIEYSANFSEDGSWLETEHELNEKDIPKKIIQIINNQFPGYKIEEAELSETKDGLVYEFDMEKGESELELTFSKDGTLIKKEEIIEEEQKY
jgi:uncharacterized membrane protein YkoI